jgi:hypothetical protein
MSHSSCPGMLQEMNSFFSKTNRKPYDLVQKTILIRAKILAGAAMKIGPVVVSFRVAFWLTWGVVQTDCGKKGSGLTRRSFIATLWVG